MSGVKVVANGSKVWPSLRQGPKVKVCQVPGGAKCKATYDACHLAWRAGLISDWYYGRRSPSDPTVVWELNGRELEREAVESELGRLREAMRVVSLAWGDWWCGFRAVVVSYADGSSVEERYDAETGRVVYVKSAA